VVSKKQAHGMRVVTAEEMADLDRRATAEFGVVAGVLMDRAGQQVAAIVSGLLTATNGRRVVVLAGKGNNGGDGLVAARYLRRAGAEVTVLLLERPDLFTGDAAAALAAAHEAGVPTREVSPETLGGELTMLLASADVLVDAIFGTGFRGSITGLVGDVIGAANRSGKPIVAVDVPSGLHADTGRLAEPHIRATQTVTLGLPKVGLVLYPGAEAAGALYIADIGYPPALLTTAGISAHLVTASMVQAVIPARRPDSHKGDHGRVLIVAGSVGFSGAAILAALGALRVGAGLVTVGVPASIYPIVASRIIEAMPTPLPASDGMVAAGALEHVKALAAACDVIGIGPGLSRDFGAMHVVTGIFGVDRPLVIDADGLNVLVGKTNLLAQARKPVVITPHPGELSRLVEVPVAVIQDDRIKSARAAAGRFRCIVVLKGARTIVAAPGGEAFVVPTGNAGMATGGMGDVLTGVIVGLMGQGVAPLGAAYAGAYLHGLAGDLIASARGMSGMLASEVADHLPIAMQRVRSGEQTDITQLLG